MKKSLLTVFLFVSLFSCSKDDDQQPKNDLDPIVGKWFRYKNDGKLVEGCDKDSYREFLENGTTNLKQFVSSPNSKECTLDYSDTGTWKKNENGTYNFSLKKDEEPFNSQVTFGSIDGSKTLIIKLEGIIYKKEK